MAGKEQFKASDFIKVIPGSGGIISTIARRVGCNWYTAKKYIYKYPRVKQAYENELEEVNDMVVSILLQSIRDGNTQDGKWWLARKRKQEFGDSVEFTGEQKVVIEVVRDRNKISDTD